MLRSHHLCALRSVGIESQTQTNVKSDTKASFTSVNDFFCLFVLSFFHRQHGYDGATLLHQLWPHCSGWEGDEARRRLGATTRCDPARKHRQCVRLPGQRRWRGQSWQQALLAGIRPQTQVALTLQTHFLMKWLVFFTLIVSMLPWNEATTHHWCLVPSFRAKVKTVSFLLPVDDIYTNRPVLSRHHAESRIKELTPITETESWEKHTTSFFAFFFCSLSASPDISCGKNSCVGSQNWIAASFGSV